MSVAQPSLQERRQAPKAALNFASNNPFRNRATSPSNAPSATAPPQPVSNENVKPRPIHTNPFLDTYQPLGGFDSDQPTISSSREPMQFEVTKPTRDGPAAEDATELMNGLSINHKPAMESKAPQYSEVEMPKRRTDDNVAIEQVGRTNGQPPALETSRHRATRSQDEKRHPGRPQDEERRQRRDLRAPRDTRERRDRPPEYSTAISKSPEKRKPVPRRNSETSIVEVLDEARKTKDVTQQTKDGSSRDPRSRDGRPGRSGKSSRRVDLIDKLDVTGIYGATTFHHDGPFDACNPHRNRKNARAAPMRAFAEGSANMALGGSGPINKNPDFEQFHGRGAQGYADYNATHGNPADAYPGFRRGNIDPRRADKFPNANMVDPKGHTQYVVGTESAGLGTSTFLEGTPVPRAALHRRESENDTTSPATSLQRKQSLAQKIRGISRPRPGVEYQYQDSRTTASPMSHPEIWCVDPETGATQALHSPLTVQSAGGRGKMHEKNPFFVDAVDRTKEPDVEVYRPVDPEQEVAAGMTRTRTTSSPQQPIARRPTMENGQSEAPEAKQSGGGLLSRVKSLKGGKRTRTDRSGSNPQEADKAMA